MEIMNNQSRMDRYKCDHCNSTFKYFSGFNKHLMSKCDSVKKNSQCYVCDKSFSSDKLMVRHISLKHLAMKTFGCFYCNGRYSTKSNLVVHIKNIHQLRQVENTFKCSNCGACFKNKQVLSTHINKKCRKGTQEIQICKIETVKVNEGIQHKCLICGKLFARLSSIKKHLKVHDAGERYKCSWCDEKFINLSHLRMHLKSIHKIKCKSNRNSVMWNALNEQNSDIFVSMNNDDDNNLNKFNEIAILKNYNPYDESITLEHENVQNLSMPVLDDLILNENSGSKIKQSEPELHDLTVKTLPQTERMKEIQILHDVKLKNADTTISSPIFKDALIGQSNAILVDGVKNDASNVERKIMSPVISLTDDVNYAMACCVREDCISNSHWNIFDCDVLPSNIIETNSSILETIQTQVPANPPDKMLDICEKTSKGCDSNILEYSESQLNNDNTKHSADTTCKSSSLINISIDLDNLSHETNENEISFDIDNLEVNSMFEKESSRVITVDNNFLTEVVSHSIESINKDNLDFGFSPLESCIEEGIVGSLIKPTICESNSVLTDNEIPVKYTTNLSLRKQYSNAHTNYPIDTSPVLSHNANTFDSKLLNSVSFNNELEDLKNELTLFERSRNEESLKRGVISSFDKELKTDEDELDDIVKSFTCEPENATITTFNSQLPAMTDAFSSTKVNNNNYNTAYSDFAARKDTSVYSYEILSENEDLHLINPKLTTLPKMQNLDNEQLSVLPEGIDLSTEKTDICTDDKTQCWNNASNKIEKLIKYYICEHCNMEFNKNTTLQRHIKALHNDNRMRDYKCECGLMYFTKQELKKHKNKYKNAPHQCPYLCKNCERIFSNKSEFRKHLTFCKNKSNNNVFK